MATGGLNRAAAKSTPYPRHFDVHTFDEDDPNDNVGHEKGRSYAYNHSRRRY